MLEFLSLSLRQKLPFLPKSPLLERILPHHVVKWRPDDYIKFKYRGFRGLFNRTWHRFTHCILYDKTATALVVSDHRLVQLYSYKKGILLPVWQAPRNIVSICLYKNHHYAILLADGSVRLSIRKWVRYSKAIVAVRSDATHLHFRLATGEEQSLIFPRGK